jgi:hypothetical protein
MHVLRDQPAASLGEQAQPRVGSVHVYADAASEAVVELRPKQHRLEVEAKRQHNAQLAADALALRPPISESG